MVSRRGRPSRRRASTRLGSLRFRCSGAIGALSVHSVAREERIIRSTRNCELVCRPTPPPEPSHALQAQESGTGAMIPSPARPRPNAPPAPDRSRRIAAALEAQRAARHLRFDLARPGALEALDALDIDSDDEAGAQFDDAIVPDDTGSASTQPAPALAKRKLGKKERKWAAYADKLCARPGRLACMSLRRASRMYAELLDLRTVDDLPVGEDWICCGPVPKGRRVLVLSVAGSTQCASAAALWPAPGLQSRLFTALGLLTFERGPPASR